LSRNCFGPSLFFKQEFTYQLSSFLAVVDIELNPYALFPSTASNCDAPSTSASSFASGGVQCSVQGTSKTIRTKKKETCPSRINSFPTSVFRNHFRLRVFFRITPHLWFHRLVVWFFLLGYQTFKLLQDPRTALLKMQLESKKKKQRWKKLTKQQPTNNCSPMSSVQ
jgi:hypothetical protein